MIAGAAAEFLAGEFGGLITTQENVVATGAAAVVGLQNNPERMAFVMINLGTTDIYLALDARVGVARGIKLTANGGAAGFNVRDDGMLPTREWQVVSPLGVGVLYTLETLRYAAVQLESMRG